MPQKPHDWSVRALDPLLSHRGVLRVIEVVDDVAEEDHDDADSTPTTTPLP